MSAKITFVQVKLLTSTAGYSSVSYIFVPILIVYKLISIRDMVRVNSNIVRHILRQEIES